MATMGGVGGIDGRSLRPPLASVRRGARHARRRQVAALQTNRQDPLYGPPRYQAGLRPDRVFIAK